MVWKQSLRASSASGDHLLKERVVTASALGGCIVAAVNQVVVRLPKWGEGGDPVCIPYICIQEVNCPVVSSGAVHKLVRSSSSRVESRVAWLKSPEIKKKASGCRV